MNVILDDEINLPDGPEARRDRVLASELKIDESQREKWLNRKSQSGKWWVCYWAGGEFVDCWGPFWTPLLIHNAKPPDVMGKG